MRKRDRWLISTELMVIVLCFMVVLVLLINELNTTRIQKKETAKQAVVEEKTPVPETIRYPEPTGYIVIDTGSGIYYRMLFTEDMK